MKLVSNQTLTLTFVPVQPTVNAESSLPTANVESSFPYILKPTANAESSLPSDPYSYCMLIPKRAFPVQPTANTKVGLHSATYC